MGETILTVIFGARGTPRTRNRGEAKKWPKESRPKIGLMILSCGKEVQENELSQTPPTMLDTAFSNLSVHFFPEAVQENGL